MHRVNLFSPIFRLLRSVGLFICLFVPLQLVADGKSLFTQACVSCHSIAGENGSSDQSSVGPDLAELIGRVAGSRPDFKYSAAMTEQGERGLIWNHETLDDFLKSPRQAVPGTTMGFAGIASVEDRTELIQWISSGVAADGVSSESADIDPALKARIEKILMVSADPDYGEYLAGECVTCHSGAAAGGVPAIDHLPPNYFVRSLLEYQSGVRTNQVMQLMAKNLGDDEIAALAAFFGKSQ